MSLFPTPLEDSRVSISPLKEQFLHKDKSHRVHLIQTSLKTRNKRQIQKKRGGGKGSGKTTHIHPRLFLLTVSTSHIIEKLLRNRKIIVPATLASVENLGVLAEFLDGVPDVDDAAAFWVFGRVGRVVHDVVGEGDDGRACAKG